MFPDPILRIRSSAVVVAIVLGAMAGPHPTRAATRVATSAAAKAAGCDYYIITGNAFSAQATRLAALRKEVSPAVAASPCIAMMQDVYKDHPPRGAKWTSLQDFLKAVHDGNRATLAHVVLLGDASFDEDSPDNHVPAFAQRIRSLDRWSQDTVYYDTLTSDDAYAAFFDSVGQGEENPRLAFAIGRIPARTPEQAEAYLDKLEAYEKRFAFGPQAFTYGFVSDDDLQAGTADGLEPIYRMPQLHQDVWDALPVKPFVHRMLSIEFPIQPDGTKPAAKDSTLGLFNAGPARVYFIGHGSPHQLTDEKIFEAPADLTRMQAKPLQPIVSMLACTTARFAAPDFESMAERFLFHPNGAVAFLGGSIPTFPGPNNDLFIRWNALALQGGTLGRTFASAKDSGWDAMNNAAYIVLGDPALSLRVPALDLTPAAGSGASRLVLEGAGAEGDSALMQVVRIDSLPFDAVMHPDNFSQKDQSYPVERVLAENRASLGAGGTVSFPIQFAGDSRDVAVKVMTWNGKGMRYGHFPLASLGEVSIKVARRRIPANKGYRLVLRGNGLVLEGNGRRLGLDGRAFR